MNHDRYVLIVLMLFVGSACATFHAKPIEPQKTAAQFEARTLSDAGLQVFLTQNSSMPVASPVTWDMQRLTLAAFYYHTDLDIARAQWATAKAAIVTAKERPNPTLNLSPEYATNAEAGFSPWVLAGILDIPIETAGKRGHRIDQAQALAEAARMHIAQTAWLVRSRVRAAFLTVYSAQRTQAILTSQMEKLNANRQLFEKRSKEGFVSPLSLTQAEVLAGKTELLLADAQRQELDGRHQLAQAVGVPIAALASVTLSSASLDAPSFIDPAAFTAWRGRAIVQRPDLLEALFTYAAAQAALQLEIAKQYPDFHIGPGFDYDQGTRKWALSSSMVLPLFNHNQGGVGEALAKREEAAARFMALQDQVIADVDRAIADYAAARQKLETANTLLATHGKQDARLQKLLRPGDVSRMTLFRAQLDLDSTRLLAADALVQFYQAQGALEDALGQTLSEDRPKALTTEINPRQEENRHAQ